MADCAFERGPAPELTRRFVCWTLVLRQVTRRDWPRSNVPAADPGHQLTQIPHIAWIAPVKEILRYRAVELRRCKFGLKASEEMLGKDDDVLAPLPQWRHAEDPPRHTIIEVLPKPTALDVFKE
jgi:hypothetical protein